MKVLYSISHSKLFCETIGNDAAHKWNAFEFKDVDVNGEMMNVYFCRNEKGMFVIAGQFRKGNPYRSCGHWHSGKLFLDVCFRKNFETRQEGNEFYKKFVQTKRI